MIKIQEAMDVMFPYRNHKDDPDLVRGQAQQVLEIAIYKRDFATELRKARDMKDWIAHERVWEDRRCAEVDYDENTLKDLD